MRAFDLAPGRHRHRDDPVDADVARPHRVDAARASSAAIAAGELDQWSGRFCGSASTTSTPCARSPRRTPRLRRGPRPTPSADHPGLRHRTGAAPPVRRHVRQLILASDVASQARPAGERGPMLSARLQIGAAPIVVACSLGLRASRAPCATSAPREADRARAEAGGRDPASSSGAREPGRGFY